MNTTKITNASTAKLMGDFITVQCKLWEKESAECHKTTTKSEKSRTTTHVNLGLRNVEMSLEIVKNTMSPQKSRAYICKLAMMLVCLTAKSTKHERTRFLLENVTECPNSGKMADHETGFFHFLSPALPPLLLFFNLPPPLNSTTITCYDVFTIFTWNVRCSLTVRVPTKRSSCWM